LRLQSIALVTVLPNRNPGSSGGFARGWLSPMDRGTRAHARFGDDDA
jgi:hypothetical protein